MKGQPRISVKQIVAGVMRDLGIQNAAANFHHFVEWAFAAERKIGSYSTFEKKIATLTLTDKRVLLPSDLINIIEVPGWDNVNSYVSGGYINADRSDGDFKLHYEAIATDDDGYPTINASHEDAVISYIMYKHKAKDYYSQKLPRYIYQDLKKEWSYQCAQARGNDNMPTKQQWRTISKYWNTLKPISNESKLF